jgi:hypothetical protein
MILATGIDAISITTVVAEESTAYQKEFRAIVLELSMDTVVVQFT